MSDESQQPITSLRAGASRVDITPTSLIALNPIGGGDFDEVHDELFLRVLVLDDGDSSAAIVSTDLIEVGNTVEIRDRIARERDIPADHVLITASHTHSAPRLGRVTPGALAHDGGPESVAYTAWVYDRLVEAIEHAQQNLQEVSVRYETGQVDVNVNRDVYVDGRWHLGYNAGGPSDKTLRVVSFTPVDGGTPVAVILNYAVHSVTTLGSVQVSADIAGAAARYVEEALGEPAVTLWTLGSVGDQNPKIQLGFPGEFTDRQVDAAFAASDAQGIMLGAEAVRLVKDPGRVQPNPSLRTAQQTFPLPPKKGVQVMSSMRQQDVDHVDLLLTAIVVGDIALAGVSGEITTSLAEQVRDASPLAATVVVSMANDRLGYLPHDEAFVLGTFEANGSPIQAGHVSTTIVDGLADLIRRAD